MDTRFKLPVIAPDANKYTRGSLLVLAGSRRYFGAGVLATLAAEKTGAGYISLATPACAAGAARQYLLCSPVIEGAEAEGHGSFSATALEPIVSELRHINALCCGPGLTVNGDTIAFVQSVLRYSSSENIPLLLDADALNALAASPGSLVEHLNLTPLIFTPHEGELARLYATLVPDERRVARATPVEMAKALSAEYGIVVVAKGATTTITTVEETYESREATPALAKAGTGDVLSGIVSSLLAQGMAAMDAAVLGVRIHSLAGVYAEQRQGRRSVTAFDVIDAIPQAVMQCE